jgi:uncharacterized protein involved in outer membrane biogenesis
LILRPEAVTVFQANCENLNILEMKKLLIIVLVVVVVGAGLLYLVGSSLLGSMVKAGVESYAPAITGTPVTLDSARISPLSGSGSISGLAVGNPEGYSTPRSIYFGQVALDIDPWSLTSGAIHVERIHIRQPEFTYERKLTTGNLDQILKNIQEATASEAATPEEEGEPVKMIIDSLIIEEGRVNVSALGFGTGADLPRIELHDIGKEQGGATPQEAALQVMEVVLGKAIAAGLEAAASGDIKIGNADTDAVIQGAGKQVQQATDAIRGLFGGKDEGADNK